MQPPTDSYNDRSSSPFGRKGVRKSGSILLALFLIVVMSLAWIALDRIKEKILIDVADSLSTVLHATTESTSIWVASQKRLVVHFAEELKLHTATKDLLAAPRRQKELLAHPITAVVREAFAEEIGASGSHGFFIITPNGISIASMRDSNVGTMNLIAQQRPGLFNRVLAGEILLIPPIRTDLQGKLLPNAMLKPTMFVAAPLLDQEGKVIAVVTLRFDPAVNFARLMKLGRVGKTGETYAFDRQARLVSESRFDRHLVEAGLIGEGERGILNVEIRDPGGNLLEGFKPPKPRSEQPFTLMAASAIAGRKGTNLQGYRDYRGVRVFGAWVWSNDMGIGLATEIDVDEALGSYYTVRATTLAVLGVTVMLSLFSALLIVHFGERTNRLLRQAGEELESKVLERTRELEESETRISAVVEGMVDGVISIDEQGTMLSVNYMVGEIFGYKQEDLIGNNLNILMPEPYKSVHDGFLKAYIETGKRNVVGGRREAEGQHKNGSIFPIDLAVSEIEVAGKKNFIGIVRDISLRKFADEQVRKLSLAVEQSPVSVVITDLDGTIEYVNPRFSQVTGYSFDEAVGENPNILKSGSHPKEFYAQMYVALTAGEDWSGEFCNRRKSGELYWEAASLCPITADDGSITHYLAVKEEITQRKLAEQELAQAKEQAESANRAKSDFLANMSHEIRTPMNAIIGLTHLCLRTELQPKQRDYITKVQSAGESLLSIVNDIMDFSKIEAGKLDLELIQFDLEEVLNNVSTMTGIKTQDKQLELVIGYAPDVPRYLIGDPLRLGQVLINLTNNAAKFTHRGEIDLLIQVAELHDEMALLRFKVRDTGIGMDEAQIETLFQSFVQADSSTTRRYGGTGLGLAICKRLVEMMDGEIAVKSKLGEGSTFSFTVRLGVSKIPIRQLLPASDLRGMRVLVVDDNETWRTVLRERLESFTFEVVTVNSGEDAVAMVESEEPFKLILMDWDMPGMNGIETARCIRDKSHLAVTPTIIMVTAYGREELVAEAEATGIQAFLIKPVNPSVLFDTVMEVFGKVPATHRRDPVRLQTTSELSEKLRGARILLAEDNLFNQQVAQELLEQSGLIVDVANNGVEAVEKVSERAYAAVLMDVQMPEMDGFRAARVIRQQPGFADLPIIAMTAGVMAGDVERCLEAGMNDHIGKPVEPQKLLATLAKWLHGATGVQFSPKAPAEPAGAQSGKQYMITTSDLDISHGLLMVGGDVGRYRRILDKFPSSHDAVVAQIRDAVADGDLVLAQRLAHSVKGSAGTVGALALEKVAHNLEMIFVDGQQDQMEPLLTTLDRKLQDLFSVIDGFGNPSNDMRNPQLEQVRLALFLEELVVMLGMDDYKASGQLDVIRPLLAKLNISDGLENLERHVEKFEFDKALAVTRLLAEQLDIPLRH